MLTTRLEAIMFTDIAGYSRMMEADEERTIDLLKKHNELVFPEIEAESGQVIDSIGDGLLVVFPSARKAVACAVTIHTRIAAHNDGAAPEDRFTLRIGIHVGEVQHEESRVYGAGVNVAARIQPFALPGGICMTEDVFRLVERRIPQEIRSIGVHELRNISRRYELYHIATGFEVHDPESDGILSLSTSPATASPRGTTLPAKRSGELDEIKEKILSEIGKWSEKGHRSRNPEIESKVFGLVERIMDRAINAWDKMPEEKKTNLVNKITVEIDGNEKKKKKKDEKKNGDIAGELVWGAAATAGFAVWYAQAGSVWMIIVGTLVGVFPLISGVQKLVKQLLRTRTERTRKPAAIEGEILKAAKELGGRVTVVQMAAHTSRALDEVQKALDAMTSRGYVVQEVLESGVIRYDFPALTSDGEESRPID
jgi:class 3 adenylate cyclase/F0F1-type ATP synthase assembly protein I